MHQIVGKEFAQTNVKTETLIKIDADHDKICNIKIGSHALNDISSFINLAVNDALSRIKKDSNECQ